MTIANFLECRGRSNYEVYSWIYKNSLGNRFLELAGCIASYQEGTMQCWQAFLRNVAGPAGASLLRNSIVFGNHAVVSYEVELCHTWTKMVVSYGL